jgi:hypothetical protein
MAARSSAADGNNSVAPATGKTAESGVEAGTGGSVLGAIGSAVAMSFLAVASMVATLWHAITADGTLAAAARQGADELGAALKAFPDSIQVQESGTVWNPTQGEIGAARQGQQTRGLGHSSYYSSYSHTAGSRESWPSELASQPRHQAGFDHGNDIDNEQDTGLSL